VLLDDDAAEAFTTSAAVNDALRAVIMAAACMRSGRAQRKRGAPSGQVTTTQDASPRPGTPSGAAPSSPEAIVSSRPETSS
jgi:hypothetical protein